MDKGQPTYRAYLIRLWRADNAGQPVWRVSLEAPGSHKQIRFDSLPALCAYLAVQMRLDGAQGLAGEQNEGGEP